jgi:bifunctional DNase/RNase
MLIEMDIKGLMVDPVTNLPIIILKDKDGDRVLSIWVGVFEANAIAHQIENVAPQRPMTHDLLRNLIADLGGKVDRIVVTVKGEPVVVDARPSDAIALALRAKAPILVDSAVIDAAKASDIVPERDDSARLSKWLESLDMEEFGKYRM